MTIPIKVSKLTKQQNKEDRYILDLDNDLNHLYSQFRKLITFTTVQATSYLSYDGSTGTSGNISLAKLTAGGADGSITVKNGLITTFTNPT